MIQDIDGIRDITIIGGGPTGLFAAFYAGMRGVSSRIVDLLSELGGHLTALYSEKYIFDVGGLPKVPAKDLARDLVEQAMQFERTRVISGGKGAFEPQKLNVLGYDELLGHGVHYAVKDPESDRGKKVLITRVNPAHSTSMKIFKDK